MKLLSLAVAACAVEALVLPSFVEQALESANKQVEKQTSTWSNAVSDAAALVRDYSTESYQSLADTIGAALHDVSDPDLPLASLGGHSDDDDDDHHEHRKHKKTLWQFIDSSEHTTRFADLVREYTDIVDLLNSTSGHKHTVFAPINEAFEHMPDDEPPAKDVIEAIIKYHIAPGKFPAVRVLKAKSIPTLFHEEQLGGRPQRLRSTLSLRGVLLNMYSKVVAVDIKASNGIIHGVSRIIVPPPMIGKEFALLPSKFSTLLYAYDKTDFVDYIHDIKMVGTTVFAPTNKAWERLGVHINAFLFNTERGLKYLKALLKYQIVPNITLYSNAIYNSTGDADHEVTGGHHGKKGFFGHKHYKLSTLLEDQPLYVDIDRVGGFSALKVNRRYKAVLSDFPAKNGVVHSFADVVLPPPCHRHHREHDEEEQTTKTGDMTLEEFIERLSPFVEDDAIEQQDNEWSDL